MKRLPNSHRFPGGFTVEIVVGQPDTGNWADYETVDEKHGRIVISEKLTPRQQWRKLAHEMIHATVDAQHYIEQSVAP